MTEETGSEKGLNQPQDVRERRITKALAENRRLLEDLVETAGNLIVLTDPEARIVLFNRACEDVTGYKREEVLGKTIPELFLSPEWVPIVQKRFADPYAPEVREPHENPWRTKSGEERIIEWRCTVIPSPEDGRPCILGTGTDITERKRMEQSLKESQSRLKILVETGGNAMGLWDPEGRLLMLNDQGAENLGGKPEDFVGKTMRELFPANADTYVSRIKQVLEASSPMEYKDEVELPTGKRWFLSTYKPVADERGTRYAVQIVSTDITELKRMENELQRYSAQLEQLVFERTKKLAESEKKYRSLVENIPDVAWTTDSDGRTIFVSPNVAKVTGRTPEEICAAGGTIWLERMHPDDIGRVKEAYEALFARNEPYDVEYRIQRKDGEWIWLHDRSVATYEKDGRKYADGLLSDITERKRIGQQAADALLRVGESEAKFRGLYDSISDGIIYNDAPGRIYDCNKAFEEMVGYSVDELRKMRWQDITPKQYLELEEGMVGEEMLKKGFSTYVEKEYIRKDGLRIPVETTASIVRGTGGKPNMIWCLVRDITERKRAEQQVEDGVLKLTESEAKFRGLYDSIRDGIVFNDLSGRIYDCNKAFEEMVGYSVDELRKMRYQDITPERYREVEDRIIGEEMVKGGFSGYIEKEYIGKDGTKIPIEVAASVVSGTGGKPNMIWAVIRDITQRKQAEEELRSARERLEHVIVSNPAVIFTGKPREDRSDYDVTYMSSRVVEMLGFEPRQFIGHPEFWDGHIHPDDLRSYRAGVPVLWKKGQCTFEYRFLHKDGAYRWIREEAKVMRDAAGNPVEVMGYWTDISQQKRMEEALLRSERLAAIGELAAMVGHDLRNPLTGIVGATYYLKTKLGPRIKDRKAREMLQLIEQDIERSDKIINDLLEYSKEIRLRFAETDVKSIASDALAEVKIPKKIRVINSTKKRPTTVVDVEKMRRVFVNLIRNAVDAMPKGGTLRITSRKSDGHLKITFADTGTGMTKETVGRIWTPLHTTKAKGIGLGLPIARRFVEAHGGSVSVETKAGRGSAFTVTVPIKSSAERKHMRP